MFSDSDLEKAHEFSSNNKAQLKNDPVCGCFHCMRIFDPAEITEWIIEDNGYDREGTAICPYCGVDSVIGKSSGYPITEEFLEAMHRYWFNEKENNDEMSKMRQR